MSAGDVGRRHPAFDVVYVHEKRHLPFLSLVGATPDRRELPLRSANTASV
jgi:hypothetical protein